MSKGQQAFFTFIYSCMERHAPSIGVTPTHQHLSLYVRKTIHTVPWLPSLVSFSLYSNTFQHLNIFCSLVFLFGRLSWFFFQSYIITYKNIICISTSCTIVTQFPNQDNLTRTDMWAVMAAEPLILWDGLAANQATSQIFIFSSERRPWNPEPPAGPSPVYTRAERGIYSTLI